MGFQRSGLQAWKLNLSVVQHSGAFLSLGFWTCRGAGLPTCPCNILFVLLLLLLLLLEQLLFPVHFLPHTTGAGVLLSENCVSSAQNARRQTMRASYVVTWAGHATKRKPFHLASVRTNNGS